LDLLNILYIGDPAAIHVQRWLRYFVQKGHIVHLVPHPDSGASNSESSLQGVQIHHAQKHIPKKLQGFYKKYLILKDILLCQQILKKYPIDLIHSHYISACGWIGAALNFHPFVLTAWGSDINVDPHRNIFYQKLSQFALRRADLITANSDDLATKIVALTDQAREVAVIQGGLETDRFPFQRGNDELRQRLGLKDELVVISTRVLGKVYNLDILVRAIPIVRKAMPGVKFLFVYRGSSDQEQGLRKLIDEVGAANSAILIGAVENSRIAEYYHLADIFVSITSSEGMPGSLTEAMACGAVPVVSDLPVIRDWMRPNINGLIVPVRDVEATAKAIVSLLLNPEKRVEIAERNRKLVIKKFDVRQWMLKMENIYYELVNKNEVIQSEK
jgi:glycosyltransferase involved in cell wall biosynthesis